MTLHGGKVWLISNTEVFRFKWSKVETSSFPSQKAKFGSTDRNSVSMTEHLLNLGSTHQRSFLRAKVVRFYIDYKTLKHDGRKIGKKKRKTKIPTIRPK